jgi:hypothetical protein
VCGFELAQEFSPEDLAQLVVGEEETWITGDPLITLIREAAAGDEAMNMGVKEKLLVQVWSTAVKPILAPKLRWATSSSVSEVASKSRSRATAGARRKKGCRDTGTVKTTWK